MAAVRARRALVTVDEYLDYEGLAETGANFEARVESDCQGLCLGRSGEPEQGWTSDAFAGRPVPGLG